mmetsp:Transcript_3180/g.7141  ORF Transcript_3180/g.7141 Transcript_3180/m.7141 type:complete len:179 (+) Transcript_3180:83-619(+)
MPSGRNDWEADLCPFGENVGFCCLSFWCPCIGYYMLSEEAAPFSFAGIKVDDSSGSLLILGLSFAMFYFVPCGNFIFTLIAAITLINHYDIDEDDCGMIFKAFCCISCYMTQMYEHVTRVPNPSISPAQRPPAPPRTSGHPLAQQPQPAPPQPPPGNRVYLLQVEADVETGLQKSVEY